MDDGCFLHFPLLPFPFAQPLYIFPFTALPATSSLHPFIQISGLLFYVVFLSSTLTCPVPVFAFKCVLWRFTFPYYPNYLRHSPTTCRLTIKLSSGLVDTWHSYMPASSLATLCILSSHSWDASSCSTLNRSSVLYLYLSTVRMWRSSCLIQDTCIWGKESLRA